MRNGEQKRMHEKGQKIYFFKIEIGFLFIEKCTFSEACVNAILKNSLGEEEKVRAASRGVGSHFHLPSIRGGKTEQPWKKMVVWSSGIEHFHFKKGISPAKFQNLQDGYAEITSKYRYTKQTKALK